MSQSKKDTIAPTSTTAHRPKTTSTSPKKWRTSAATLGSASRPSASGPRGVPFLEVVGEGPEPLGHEGVEDREQEDGGGDQVEGNEARAGGEGLRPATPATGGYWSRGRGNTRDRARGDPERKESMRRGS